MNILEIEYVDQIRRTTAATDETLEKAQTAHRLVTLDALRCPSEQGLSIRDIASIVGLSKSSICRRLRRRDAVAGRTSPAVMKLVRRAWKHAEPAPTELGAEPLQRRPWSRLDEIERATREGGVMGVGWPYRVTAYKFMGRDEATRDSLSVALGQSAWMAESLDAAASEDACMLWGVWRNLQHAETTAQFDCAMRALHDLAELDGCWIELLEASRAD